MRADRAPAPAVTLNSVRLIVLSRAPVPGQTKTRLIPAFGADAAAAFHAACLAEILSEAEAWRQAGLSHAQVRALTLCVTPPDSWPDFVRAGIALPPGAALTFQEGETLGARMVHALAGALDGTLGSAGGGATGPAAHAPADAALLVGSDLPLLLRSHLEAAGAALLDGALPGGAEPRRRSSWGPPRMAGTI